MTDADALRFPRFEPHWPERRLPRGTPGLTIVRNQKVFGRLHSPGGEVFSGLTTDTLVSPTTLEANTYTVNVNAAGDSAAIFTGSYSLSKDQTYTAIIWGRQSSLRVSTIGEAEDTNNIADGNTRIRMFNATLDSGTVDIYVTTADVDPADVSPTQSGLTSGTLGGFRELTAKTYRIRVTGTGDPADVRLDIPSVTLAAKTYYTLAITEAGEGGVLLNGTLIAQQSTATSVKNNKARVRMAAVRCHRAGAACRPRAARRHGRCRTRRPRCAWPPASATSASSPPRWARRPWCRTGARPRSA